MKVLLLGDSLFAGQEGKLEPHINDSLRQIIPEIEIRNLAESGDNSFDLLDKLEKQDFAGADWVFVWIGANDLATHKQVYLGEFQENMRQIVHKLLTRYSANQIILLSPAPVDERKQVYRTNRLVAYYSEIVEQVAYESCLDYISMEFVFEQTDFPLQDILRGSRDDGLHFGSLGYTILAQTLSEYIKTKSR